MDIRGQDLQEVKRSGQLGSAQEGGKKREKRINAGVRRLTQDL